MLIVRIWGFFKAKNSGSKITLRLCKIGYSQKLLPSFWAHRSWFNFQKLGKAGGKGLFGILAGTAVRLEFF